MAIGGTFIHLTPGDDEERVVNMGEVREAYRKGKTVGWTYDDGTVSSCVFPTVHEAEDSFAKISDLLTEDTSGAPLLPNYDYLGVDEVKLPTTVPYKGTIPQY